MLTDQPTQGPHPRAGAGFQPARQSSRSRALTHTRERAVLPNVALTKPMKPADGFDPALGLDFPVR